jgi:hypothetical protein
MARRSPPTPGDPGGLLGCYLVRFPMPPIRQGAHVLFKGRLPELLF